MENDLISTKQGIFYFAKVDEDKEEGILYLNGREIEDVRKGLQD